MWNEREGKERVKERRGERVGAWRLMGDLVNGGIEKKKKKIKRKKLLHTVSMWIDVRHKSIIGAIASF